MNNRPSRSGVTAASNLRKPAVLRGGGGRRHPGATTADPVSARAVTGHEAISNDRAVGPTQHVNVHANLGNFGS